MNQKQTSEKNQDRFFMPATTEITGVKRLRLHQWMGKGYISPSIHKAQGVGTKHIFSREDLCLITLFKRLVESGMSRSLVAAYTNIKESLMMAF
jgi:hypothetical protein